MEFGRTIGSTGDFCAVGSEIKVNSSAPAVRVVRPQKASHKGVHCDSTIIGLDRRHAHAGSARRERGGADTKDNCPAKPQSGVRQDHHARRPGGSRSGRAGRGVLDCRKPQEARVGHVHRRHRVGTSGSYPLCSNGRVGWDTAGHQCGLWSRPCRYCGQDWGPYPTLHLWMVPGLCLRDGFTDG